MGPHCYLVLIDVDCDQGPEYLLAEDSVGGRGCLHDGRLDKVAHAVVIRPASNDLRIWRALGVLNISRYPVNR